MRRRTAAFALVMALGRHAHAACPLEQSWQVGEANSWEEISFVRGGHGMWVEGDRHGEDRRSKVDFRWQRDGSRLVVTAGGVSRVVRFTIERNSQGGCTLRFDHSPVANAGTEFWGNP